MGKGINESMQEIGGILMASAPQLYAYYRMLREQGFTDSQAMALVRDVQDALLSPLHSL